MNEVPAGADSVLPALAVLAPLVGTMALQVVPAGAVRRVVIVCVLAMLAVTVALVDAVLRGGAAVRVAVGGWEPPLGLALRADGTSAALLCVAAAVSGATAWYGLAVFPARETRGARDTVLFFSLMLAIWSALAAIAMAEDLFNLYVALELLTFAAVPLVALEGRRATVEAAYRYLVFALAGSMLYLLGAGILYGAAGTLDMAILARTLPAGAAATLALALMTAGLLAKAALFPLHFWLPPAHAGAPPAASAVLSGLVVKAPFFLLLRLWFDVAPQGALAAAPVLGALGALAILHGSAMALGQPRLKTMIAYSTAAQLGYLFLVFPLASGGPEAPWSGPAWTGGMVQLAAHAFAKGAMFLSAGILAGIYGHDRIDGLGGFGRVAPISAAAFALGGLSLVGLPPSGGFTAKWLLLASAAQGGHWILAAVILAGGLMAAGYVFRVLGKAWADVPDTAVLAAAVPLPTQLPALLLALAAVALGALPLEPLAWLAIGRAGLGGAP